MLTFDPDEAAVVLVNLASQLQALASLARKLLKLQTFPVLRRGPTKDTLAYPMLRYDFQNKRVLLWQENCFTSHCF